jgi:hypothetical protein
MMHIPFLPERASSTCSATDMLDNRKPAQKQGRRSDAIDADMDGAA